ncbi:hypothetical protein Tamer19_22860 [Cupriavidus sp. TA19]|nr:hypothetical protein Tamer19_22860 [Cupriavidus sp. TA19]
MQAERFGQCGGIKRTVRQPREYAKFDGRKQRLRRPETHPELEQALRREYGPGRIFAAATRPRRRRIWRVWHHPCSPSAEKEAPVAATAEWRTGVPKQGSCHGDRSPDDKA